MEDTTCIDMNAVKKKMVLMKNARDEAEDHAELAKRDLKSVTDEKDVVSSFIHDMDIYCRFLILLTD